MMKLLMTLLFGGAALGFGQVTMQEEKLPINKALENVESQSLLTDGKPKEQLEDEIQDDQLAENDETLGEIPSEIAEDAA